MTRLYRDLLLLVVAATLPHAPFLTSGCLTDDFVHIGQLVDRAALVGVFGTVDGFGFYRPIQTASYVLNGLADDFACTTSFRVTNLILHVGVVLGAYALAFAVLVSRPAALLAALMFALAPKAAPIVVMWISARSEILMALFSIGAALLWLRWLRDGRVVLLLGVMACYTAAVLSKEAAVLLPFALTVLPGGNRSLRARTVAIMALLLVVPLILAFRTAMQIPLVTVDFGAYEFRTSPLRWIRNYTNYFGRAVVPAALVLIAIWLARFRTPRPSLTEEQRHLMRPITFGLVWFTVFVLPVLPLVLRSEARIYLPAFGLCLAAAAVAKAFLMRHRETPIIALAIVALLLGGYQAGRSYRMREQAQFSESFVRQLPRVEPFVPLPVSIIPADAHVEELLRGAVDAYAQLVYQDVVHSKRTVTIVPAGTFPPGTRHLVVEYRDGSVHFKH